ncbi:MAG TPA: VOC family protein [Gemmatimonadaceae bacterium]|nr:VOC family protein [Gemmatimonadaceae bacterium]
MATTATPATGIPATGTRGRFVWHDLMTTDIAAARAFYEKVVGWKTTKLEGGEMEYALLLSGETPETAIGGVMTLPAEAAAMGAPPSWLAYIEVPDTDATIDQAVKLGAKVHMPAKTIDQVGRFAVLQDPQGGSFAVITSATPLQPETDPAPRQFSWHELTTTDQAAAISFYEQLFGWEKKSEFDMGDMGIYYMYGRDRFTYGGIMRQTPQGPGTYWLHYVLVADSADAATERAKNAGATLMVGPMEVPGGDRIAVLRDPQGAVFAVQSKPT